MAQPAQPADRPDAIDTPTLGDRDMAILAFEHLWWKHAGAKEEDIRREFGLSAARYYQLLNTLIDSPAAIVHDPMLVRRLQRIRDTRTSERAARTSRMTPVGRVAPHRRRTDD